jgi:hypothetical protein
MLESALALTLSPAAICVGIGDGMTEFSTLDEVICVADVGVVVVSPALDVEESEERLGITVLVMTIGDPADGVTVTMTRVLSSATVMLLVCVRVLILTLLDEKVDKVGIVTLTEVDVLFPPKDLVAAESTDDNGDEVASMGVLEKLVLGTIEVAFDLMEINAELVVECWVGNLKEAVCFKVADCRWEIELETVLADNLE